MDHKPENTLNNFYKDSNEVVNVSEIMAICSRVFFL